MQDPSGTIPVERAVRGYPLHHAAVLIVVLLLMTTVTAGGSAATAQGKVREYVGRVAVRRSPSSTSPVGVLTDGAAVLAIADVAKPAYLAPITPAPFGTRLTRIAGEPGTAIQFANGATGVWSSDARHHYSTDEPWNADQTLIAIDQPGGNPDLLFLDGTTYQPKYPRCANYNRQDDRWHPSLPTVRINANGTLLEWFDIVQCRQVKAWTLPFAVTYLGLTNGNVSNDGRLIALGTTSQMFIVDMVTNQFGPAMSIAYGGWTPTGLGVSASGKYAWVHYSGDYNRIFDLDPITLTLTPHPEVGVVCHGAAADGFIYDLGHQDVALNPFDNDEDVMIGQEHCGNVGKTIAGQLMGHVVMVRLRDGAITSLTDPTNEAYAYHVSGRATDRPGWVYVSYYEDGDGLRFNQELISVKMDGSKAVERWAHLHTDTTNCYRCEAHPVPSRDGLRVLFASAWNTACDGVCGTLATRQDYIVDRGAVGDEESRLRPRAPGGAMPPCTTTVIQRRGPYLAASVGRAALGRRHSAGRVSPRRHRHLPHLTRPKPHSKVRSPHPRSGDCVTAGLGRTFK